MFSFCSDEVNPAFEDMPHLLQLFFPSAKENERQPLENEIHHGLGHHRDPPVARHASGVRSNVCAPARL
jgi:hypothetical protein